MHECVWCVRAIGLWIISQWHRMNAAFVCSISINSNQCVHFNCRRDAFFLFHSECQKWIARYRNDRNYTTPKINTSTADGSDFALFSKFCRSKASVVVILCMRFPITYSFQFECNTHLVLVVQLL